MTTSSSFKNLSSNFTISPDGSHEVLSVPIEKSDNDERSYRLIRLSNELEALLIHDAKTDKSSASLDVHVGNLCDPVGHQRDNKFFFFFNSLNCSNKKKFVFPFFL